MIGLIRTLAAPLMGIACMATAQTGSAPTTAPTSFPSKPVWIVTGPAGSGPDILSRILAQKLSEEWRQPVMIDNRVGAMGNIGARLVATSPADGHMLFVGTAAYSISANM